MTEPQTLQVEAGRTLVLDVQAWPDGGPGESPADGTGSVELHLVDEATDEPVPGVAVYLVGEGGDVVRVVTGKDGVGSRDGVPAGTYRISLEPPSGLRLTHRVLFEENVKDVAQAQNGSAVLDNVVEHVARVVRLAKPDGIVRVVCEGHARDGESGEAAKQVAVQRAASVQRALAERLSQGGLRRVTAVTAVGDAKKAQEDAADQAAHRKVEFLLELPKSRG